MTINKDLLTKIVLTTVLWTCSFILVPIFVFTATPLQWLITFVIYYFIADWIVSATLHHACSHKDWNPPRWWTILIAYLGTMLGQGTPLTWAAWHRYHHRTSDTPSDPHSPRYSSFFWVVFCIYWQKYDMKSATDWVKDKHIVWITKHQLELSLISFIGLYLLLPFDWFLTVWAVPLALGSVGPSIGHAIIGHWGCFYKDKGGDGLRDTMWIFPFAFSGYRHKTHHEKMGMPSGRWVISTRIIKLLCPNRIKKEVDDER